MLLDILIGLAAFTIALPLILFLLLAVLLGFVKALEARKKS